MENSIKFYAGGENTQQWLLTTAIGNDYLKKWEVNFKPSWLDYALRYNLGIAVVIDNIFNDKQHGFNGAWQKMLAPKALKNKLGFDVSCVLLDTDILIAPGADNIFDEIEEGKLGIVSQEKNLPYDIKKLRNRIALLRNKYMDSTFPLASILNATPKDLFNWAKLDCNYDDYFCSGMIVLDTKFHADLFEDWYQSAPTSEDYVRLASWEETWINYCIQSTDQIQWLDYSWQALWIYEVASLYPFLYYSGIPKSILAYCLGASMLRCNFLHFAGRWESTLVTDVYPNMPMLEDDFIEFSKKVRSFELENVKPVLRGVLKP